MDQFILRTKLNIPTLRRGALDREGLIQILERGQDGRILLVTAPAGYGKTTLIVQWLQQQESAVCWLTLGIDENDPADFFNLLMAAVQTQAPEFDGVPFPAWRDDPELQKSALTGLINSLALLTQPLIIVLDDYHQITSKQLHADLDFMIEHLPPNILIVMTSRERPNLSLPRWRARGWLTELTQAELKFDNEQSSRFFREMMALPLSDQEVEWVNERVDGWVTGLQFTGLRLQKSGRSENFLEMLSPDNKVDRYSADYLLSEVMEREPEATQTFLLRTSILDRMSGPLCDALLDIDSGQAQLEEMEMRNLFTMPLDHHGEWFRYHPVMSDLLKAKLELMLSPDEIKQLHRRAAVWFDENNWLEESIQHALAAEDYELAVQFMYKLKAIFLWQEGGVRNVSAWLGKLPEHYLIKYPHLGIMSIGASLVRGEMGNILHYLKALEGKEEIEGEWHAIQGNLKRNDGQIDAALADLEVAMEAIDQDDVAWTILVYMQLIQCYREKGDFGKMKELVAEAQELFGRHNNNPAFVTIMLHWFQGIIAAVQGDLNEACQLLKDGLELVKAAPIHQRSSRGYLLTGLSDIYCDWYDLEQAELYARQTLEIGHRTGIGDMTINGTINLINIAVARKDKGAVDELFSELNGIVLRSQFKPFEKMFERLEFSSRLRLGESKPAVEWAKRSNFFDEAESTELLLEERRTYMLWAQTQLHICRTQTDAARKPALEQLVQFCKRLIKLAEEAPDFFVGLDACLILAETEDLLGHYSLADEALGRACAMGEGSGVVLPFLECLPFLERAIVRAGDDSRLFLQRVVTAETPQPSLKAIHPDLEMVIELTSRERDMLQALTDGLSNKEIEARLVISRNTVRTHLRNLYSKLDVESRTQAVLKAQEMGIV
ncbi:MAG: LuxR C-terminal-related transcriptional regulator [Anaerolineae bacterium]